jgi:hypothetical protein
MSQEGSCSVQSTWIENIRACLEIVEQNGGPSLVAIVSGSEADRLYWEQHCARTARDIYKKQGDLSIVSVSELTRKGNFLGTLNAWRGILASLEEDRERLPGLAVINMLFGQGKRLSPFTQALHNRKPAFPTPRRGDEAQVYLQMADLSGLSNNILIKHLERGGFRGCVVKWGDEAIIPGHDLLQIERAYEHFHAVRVISRKEITEELAREKEWIVADTESQHMHSQYARQSYGTLLSRLEQFGDSRYYVGVNLGTIAVSYVFLELALEVFGPDVDDPAIWLDWDPYFWIALYCPSPEAWQREIAYEDRDGRGGIRALESRYPDFYARVTRFRQRLEQQTGRPLAVGVIDFGTILWTDFGLHSALRRNFQALLEDSEAGMAYRALFGIEGQRDRNGNLLIRSSVPETASIKNALIIDSTILDGDSVVDGAIIVGGRHRRVEAPEGGVAIFCAVDQLRFEGPNGVAFRSIGGEVSIPAGGRHTTLLLPSGMEHLTSNESVISYEGTNYSEPLAGNAISFEEAARLAATTSAEEQRWASIWESWLAETSS